MADTLDPLGGVHHVTGVARNPTDNQQFYTETLGLRLVKRTVNFDDPSTHHLYYGDRRGTPGTTTTFFVTPDGRRASSGVGEVGAVAFRVPVGSLDDWRARLPDAALGDRSERFGDRVLSVTDPDGITVELIERPTADDAVEPWTEVVPSEQAIRGLHGVTLRLSGIERTASVLETLGFERGATDGPRTRFTAGATEDAGRAGTVDLVNQPETSRGDGGVGSIHHVAFRVPDAETQDAWRARLVEAGHRVSEPKDRRYFRSIYVREPGGVLIEIATDGPGFTRDESVADLGSSLQLPPWLADDRERIEAALPSITPDVSADE